MKVIIYRIAGILVILTCIAGISLSAIGIAMIWNLRPVATIAFTQKIQSTRTILTTSSQGLDLVRQVLTDTITSLDTIESTLEMTAESIETTQPALDEVITLTQDNLPKAIETAQTSIESVREAAQVIDGVLRALTVIPFVRYNPPVPIHLAFDQVSASLNDIPDSITSIGTSLESTKENVAEMQTTITSISTDIARIEKTLEGSQIIITGYQTLLHDLETQLDELIGKLTGWMNLLAWGLTIPLSWLILLQLSLLVVGWELLRRASEFKQSKLDVTKKSLEAVAKIENFPNQASASEAESKKLQDPGDSTL